MPNILKIILLIDTVVMSAVILFQKGETNSIYSITGDSGQTNTVKRKKYTDRLLTNITVITGIIMFTLDLAIILLISRG